MSVLANLFSVSLYLPSNAGTGVREDVYLIWKELEEAKNILTQIEKILIEFEKSETVAGIL